MCPPVLDSALNVEGLRLTPALGLLVGGLLGLAACGDSEPFVDASPPADATRVSEAGPALRVNPADVEQAIGYPEQTKNGLHDPVLLIHGTGSTSFESWGSTYVPALTHAEFEVFTLDLPGKAYTDIQWSAEYLVYALRRISAVTGRRVDVIGHSQGGLDVRWALKWWPETRALVDDLITLGTPHHGTVIVEVQCAVGCKPAHRQMMMASNFLAALNAGDELGLAEHTTSIFSLTDELVQPQLPESTSALPGAANIAVQDLCPGRPVDHVGLMRDGAVWILVLDALLHDGPADLARLNPLACVPLLIPGIGLVESLQANYYFFASGNSDVPDTQEEPELEAYARQ